MTNKLLINSLILLLNLLTNPLIRIILISLLKIKSNKEFHSKIQLSSIKRLKILKIPFNKKILLIINSSPRFPKYMNKQ